MTARHWTATITAALLLIGCSGSDNGEPDSAVPDGEGPLPGIEAGGDVAPVPPDGTTEQDSKPWPTQPCGFKTGSDSDLAGGWNVDFTMSGIKRKFYVLKINVPPGFSGKLPVVFVYGGWYSTAASFNNITAADAANKPFIKVVPQAVDTDTMPVWDFQTNPDQSVDVKFFDEMIGCLHAEFPIDTNRIHILGGSMGGHFVDYLVTHRGYAIASFMQLSGGFRIFPQTESYYFNWPVDALLAKLANKMPGIVDWGGPTDIATGYDYHQGALEAIQKLKASGHFVATCNHGQGHDGGTLAKFGYLFFEDHPRGVKPDPYVGGLPNPTPFGGADQSWPAYCAIAN